MPPPAAVNVVLPPLQITAIPLILAIGAILFVKTTSSVEEHVPLVKVQRNVTELPAVKPVTVVVALLLGAVIDAPFAAPIIDQIPLPTEGVLAAKVNVPLLHCVWSTPALDVTSPLLVTEISLEALHAPFVTVHLKTVVVFGLTPVTVVVTLFVEETVPVPLTTLQIPVPTEGVVAAILKVEVLQSV